MNLGELCTDFGYKARDRALPGFWDTTRRRMFANQALMEAVRRSKLIIDSTASICTIAFTTTNPVLNLDSRIIGIREAIVSGATLPLDPYHIADMPYGWRSTTGTPAGYITDYGSNQIRLYPQPTTAGTLLLSVFREPLEDMANDSDEPEIPARYHADLVQWMLFLAFDEKDAETNDPQAAAKAEKKFTAAFGQRVSARNEKWQSETGAGFPDSLA